MTADCRWAQVTCRTCLRTWQCTPENDYYGSTTTTDGQCMHCMMRDAGMDPETTPVLVIDAATGREIDPRDLALLNGGDH
jgi:hypothetical protein